VNQGEFFEHLFSRAPVAVALLETDGSISEMNQNFASQFGYDAKRLRGSKFQRICSVSGTGEGIKMIAGWEGEVEMLASSGKKQRCLLSLVDCRDFDRLAAFLFILGSRKRRGTLQKLESIGALAGTIAHDLNNILTGILGHVSFLRLTLEGNDSHGESVTAIEDGARRASSLTQQILNFAREEETKTERVNLTEVLRSACNITRGSLPKNVSLETDTPNTDVFILGDESKLSQILVNLIVNAKEALPKGGTIAVSLERLVVDAEYCQTHPGLVPGRFARLSIADTGVGMPSEIRERIFEPFFTTKGTSGTGLGLATVFATVQAHDGYIEVQSEPGEGTSFELLLPSDDFQEEQRFDEEDEDAVPRGTESILVVDDEPVVRTIIQRSLEHLGYTVETASNGVEAVEMYHPDRYGLIVLDIMMPKMAGDEVFATLKRQFDEVPVILISGYSSEGRARAVLDQGGLGFIQKPFAIEELARQVRRCLDKIAK